MKKTEYLITLGESLQLKYASINDESLQKESENDILELFLKVHQNVEDAEDGSK